LDEVDAHVFVFETDAAHHLMLGVRSIVILGGEGEVELFVTEIVGFGAITQPSEFKDEIRAPIGEVDNLEGAIFGDDFTARGETKRITIEGNAAFEMEDVDIEVIKFKHSC
jgi:hypothetical protein